MIINHKFTTLNQYINATRTNRYVSAKIKKSETEIARLSLLGSPKLNTPCKLRFIWSCADKRTDLDNIVWARKFIIDGMVKAGIIENDSMKYIIGFEDVLEFSDTWKVRIEVIE